MSPEQEEIKQLRIDARVRESYIKCLIDGAMFQKKQIKDLHRSNTILLICFIASFLVGAGSDIWAML